MGAELGTSTPSNSSVNIKETTTTETSEDWNFNISPYVRFGFTSSQMKQLASIGVGLVIHSYVSESFKNKQEAMIPEMAIRERE